MKKITKLIIINIIIIITFMISSGVDAEPVIDTAIDLTACKDSTWGCAVCKYKSDRFETPLVFEIKSDGENVSARHTSALKSDVFTYTAISNTTSLDISIFAKSNPQVPTCPKVLYGEISENHSNYEKYVYITNRENNNIVFELKNYDSNNKVLFSDTTRTLNISNFISTDCEGMLGTDMVEFLQKIFNWIRIIAPIIVIVLTSVDFAGALIKDDKDALSKVTGKLVKRLIVVIVLFFIPTIINFILDIYNDVRGSNIENCI